ncbi:MAG: stage II sporulation protein M [Promethearchaeota archaeon]
MTNYRNNCLDTIFVENHTQLLSNRNKQVTNNKEVDTPKPSSAFWILSFLIVVVAYISGIIIGWFTPLPYLSDNEPNNSWFSPLFLFSYILRSNITFVIIILILGVLTFGVGIIINLWLQGFINILVIRLALQVAPLHMVLVSFFPHAIVEITAILWSAAIGLYLPLQLIRYLFGYRSRILIHNEPRQIVISIPIILILLVIAAFIESFVTPQLMGVLSIV